MSVAPHNFSLVSKLNGVIQTKTKFSDVTVLHMALSVSDCSKDLGWHDNGVLSEEAFQSPYLAVVCMHVRIKLVCFVGDVLVASASKSGGKYFTCQCHRGKPGECPYRARFGAREICATYCDSSPPSARR